MRQSESEEIVTGVAYIIFGNERQKSNSEPVPSHVSVDEYYRHGYMLLTREQIDELNLSGLPMLEEHIGAPVGSIMSHWRRGDEMYIRARVTDARAIEKVRSKELCSLSVHYAVYPEPNPDILANSIGRFNMGYWCRNTHESSILFEEISLTRDPFFKGCDLVTASGGAGTIKARHIHSGAFRILASNPEEKKDQKMSSPTREEDDDMMDETPLHDKDPEDHPPSGDAPSSSVVSGSSSAAAPSNPKQETPDMPTNGSASELLGIGEEEFEKMGRSERWRYMNTFSACISSTLGEKIAARRKEFDETIAPGLENSRFSAQTIEKYRNDYLKSERLGDAERIALSEMVDLGKRSFPQKNESPSSVASNSSGPMNDQRKRDSSHLEKTRPEESNQKKTKTAPSKERTTDRLMDMIWDNAYKNSKQTRQTEKIDRETPRSSSRSSDNGRPSDERQNSREDTPLPPLDTQTFDAQDFDTVGGRMAISANAIDKYVRGQNINPKVASMLSRYSRIYSTIPDSTQSSTIDLCHQIGTAYKTRYNFHH